MSTELKIEKSHQASIFWDYWIIKLDKNNQNYVDAVDASTECWARGGKQTKVQHNDEEFEVSNISNREN